MKKLRLIIIFVLIILYAFPQQRTTLLHSKKYSVNDSLNEKYAQIINGLNLNYVLWYTQYQRSHNERTWFRKISYSEFLQDSITYSKCYKEFFSQDLDIIRWLLTFKNDDTYEHPIWQPIRNPYSSYIPSWYFHPSNSQLAITLIEIYLNGSGFERWEYFADNFKLTLKKRYHKVSKFIKENRDKSNVEVRELWKKKNAR